MKMRIFFLLELAEEVLFLLFLFGLGLGMVLSPVPKTGPISMRTTTQSGAGRFGHDHDDVGIIGELFGTLMHCGADFQVDLYNITNI